MVFEYILKQNNIDPASDLTIDQNIDFGSTAAAFSEEKADNIIVDNNLENATEHDFCFVERQEVRIEEINKLIVYRWDKIYPADKYFNMDDIKCNLVETLEFQGYSHEKIIREIYQLI